MMKEEKEARAQVEASHQAKLEELSSKLTLALKEREKELKEEFE